tara:strand:+ start:743 stop:895 length:153 start_codon:yes stop_codon:yes gene_type:complete
MIHLKPLDLQSLHKQRSISAAQPERGGIEFLRSDDQTNEAFDHPPAHRLA